MSSIQVSVAQAKAEFAALVARAESGEDVIVTRNGRPVARLTHLERAPMLYGDLAGIGIPTDLAALSIPDDVADAFDGR
jgi:prevent-host-death family protein